VVTELEGGQRIIGIDARSGDSEHARTLAASGLLIREWSPARQAAAPGGA
jgi:hypothetical protein